MKVKKIFILIIFCLITHFSFAQHGYTDEKYIDTATSMVWTEANFSFQFPAGHLADLFSNNYNIGTGFTYKTASNWTWSVKFNYLFGSNIDNATSVLGDIVNSNGDVIDGNGLKATIYMEGRYWTLGAGFGKIIPVNRWKNSGIWLQGGFGFFQHKIHFTDPDSQVAQFLGNYKKGYDQRSSGFYMSQFVGYLFMQKRRIASFYAGVEIYEMWTKPDRNYIFTQGPTENMPYKFSALLGLKIGWIVPLYEKKRVTTFYQY